MVRIDHWFKNVFMVPGIVAAIGVDRNHVPSALGWNIVVGLFAACLVASSNYTINEMADAPFDRWHPVKHRRPAASGQISIRLGYVQWIALMVLGVGLGLTVSIPFAATLLVLWLMGCVYNLPPFRTKDVAYLDVLTESINNPLRLLAGWFIAGPASIAPSSLLLSYWMVGCYFMALKRFAEYRDIADPARAAAYRPPFAVYSEERLLTSSMFYGSAAMLFLGAFTVRYRFELILAFPLVALVMALYLKLAFKPRSPVQRPERLYREPLFMGACALCSLALLTLLVVDLPMLPQIFVPTAPTVQIPRPSPGP
jgi:decaprenyl-phosphate phosphoribosyltransferase